MGEARFDLSGKKLFVALPAYDFKVSLKLAVSLMRMAQAAISYGVDIQVGSVCGCSVVSRARNLLTQDFIESPCDYLLFIDSDINFEPEHVFRLMAWASRDPNKGIVAAVPRIRDTNTVYIADLDHDSDGSLTMNGQGLIRAKRVATAFMLVQRVVFEALVRENPDWKYYDHRSKRNLSAVFDFKVTAEGYMGEDFLFCDRARDAGFEVWVDPSITLGHMGVQEYVGNFGEDVVTPMITRITKREAA